MIIQLMSDKSFENQRLLAILNSTINLNKAPNMFIKSNEVGVYDIERMHKAMTKKEKKEFWKAIVEQLNTVVDATLDKNTLYIYKKGESKATDENSSNKEAKQQSKKAAGKPATDKPSEVSPESE